MVILLLSRMYHALSNEPDSAGSSSSYLLATGKVRSLLDLSQQMPTGFEHALRR